MPISSIFLLYAMSNPRLNTKQWRMQDLELLQRLIYSTYCTMSSFKREKDHIEIILSSFPVLSPDQNKSFQTSQLLHSYHLAKAQQGYTYIMLKMRPTAILVWMVFGLLLCSFETSCSPTVKPNREAIKLSCPR